MLWYHNRIQHATQYVFSFETQDKITQKIKDIINSAIIILMSQTFWTILVGVTVFVLGQIIQNFFLKPIQDLKRVIGEISHKVKFHSNIITNSGVNEEMINKASGDMRDLSCQLE